jgi:hypothetical protein
VTNELAYYNTCMIISTESFKTVHFTKKGFA